MDLFFYREPEEAKEKEEEELPVIAEYTDYTATSLGGGPDWSAANIPDSHWSGEAAPVPVVTSEWTGETGK